MHCFAVTLNVQCSAMPCHDVLCCAGQKGIGFKSVFRITQCPHIHTNGFHFAFDLTQHGNLGYVLPTWLGDQPLEPELLQALENSALLKLKQQQLGGGGSSGSKEDDSAAVSAAAVDSDVGKLLAELMQQQQDEPEEQEEQLDEEEMRHQQQQQVWLQQLGSGNPLSGAESFVGESPSAITTAAVAAAEHMLGGLTAIHLPLRPECDEVSQKLDTLRPTLLLFLRKLRCLMLTDAVAGEVRASKGAGF